MMTYQKTAEYDIVSPTQVLKANGVDKGCNDQGAIDGQQLASQSLGSGLGVSNCFLWISTNDLPCGKWEYLRRIRYQ